MKHARTDYNRIQDPEGKIPADEPVFLLRGQDALFIPMLRVYAELARSHGLERMADLVENHARAAAHWRAGSTGTVKIPDVPDEAVPDKPAD